MFCFYDSFLSLCSVFPPALRTQAGLAHVLHPEAGDTVARGVAVEGEGLSSTLSSVLCGFMDLISSEPVCLVSGPDLFLLVGLALDLPDTLDL